MKQLLVYITAIALALVVAKTEVAIFGKTVLNLDYSNIAIPSE